MAKSQLLQGSRPHDPHAPPLGDLLDATLPHDPPNALPSATPEGLAYAPRRKRRREVVVGRARWIGGGRRLRRGN